MALDVLDVVELWSEGVVDVDDDDFPVCLAFVEEGHDAEDLDLFHLTSVTNLLADLADVKRVVVTLCLCLCMSDVWILPGLLGHGSGMNSGEDEDGEEEHTWGKAP